MSINPLLPAWLLILIIVLMTVTFLWTELRRPLRFPLARAAAVIIMMTAITAIMFRPGHMTEDEHGTILLTGNYSKGIADSILIKSPGNKIVTLDAIPFLKATSLKTHHQLNEFNAIRTVVGDGLPSYALSSIHNNFKYYPSTSTSGVRRLFLPRDVRRNQLTHIAGEVETQRDSATLILEAGGQRIDSVNVDKGKQHFNLRFIPRTNGEVVYNLRLTTDTIRRPIPLHIREAQPLNILLVQAFPTFEIQYLKNFLADKGHRLVIRYQLSKGIYRYEYANRAAVRVDRLSKSLLSEFDMIITDMDLLSALSSAERDAVAASVRDGMGIIVQGSTTGLNKFPDQFMAADFIKATRDTTTIIIGAKAYTLPTSPVRIKAGAGIVPTLKNKSGILDGYAYKGRGKVGFQLLGETYRLLLSGDSIGYSTLWSPLIDGVAGVTSGLSELAIKTELPLYEDEPFQLTLISSHKRPVVYHDSVLVPMTEDIAIDDIWSGKLWAPRAGWHILSSNTGDSLHYYVNDAEDWNDLRTFSNRASTKAASLSGSDISITMVMQPYPPIIFYLALMIAAAFLWLAPKL